MSAKTAVLFLCSHNSARSIMAEAILRHHAGDRFEAHSAGLDVRGINPLTLRVLREEGLPTDGLRSKSIGEYLGKVAVHHAIVVCEQAAQSCPTIYPFAMNFIKWPFPDPSAATGDEEERLAAFRDVFQQVRTRLLEWIDTVPARGVDAAPLS